MGFLGSFFGGGEKCKICRTSSSLNDYAIGKILKSKIVEEEDFISRNGQKFTLKNGEVIEPDSATKMGKLYCYWTDFQSFDPNNIPIVKLCSRKCAKKYAKQNTCSLVERFAAKLEIIWPHQQEMDKFKYENNIGDGGFKVT